MMNGKVIIDFKYDDDTSECSWNINQEGGDTLNNENLIFLLQHIIGELTSD